MSGYLICKGTPKEEVEKIMSSFKLWYDEALSNALKMSIFWTDTDIENKELLVKVKGGYFILDEVIVMGVKWCAENLDMNLIKK